MIEIDVHKIRKTLKLTQQEFADRIGVDRRTIINYEQGGKIPKSKLHLFEAFISDNNTPVVTYKNSQNTVNSENLENIIKSLKEHIVTLKELVIEKDKLLVIIKNKNQLLKDKILLLEEKYKRE